MSIEAWAEAARRNEYRQDPEYQDAIGIVKDLLEDKTDSDSAAVMIASVYNPLLKRSSNTMLCLTL